MVVPAVTFDPESELSIANVVIRNHNGEVAEPSLPGDAASFLERLTALV